MDIKVGTDIIEVERIQKSIDEMGDNFINRIFTDKEKRYCEGSKQNKYQHYAARFAGKEAVFKAVSSLFENKYDIAWRNIEITNDKQGKPQVTFLEIEEDIVKQIQSIDLSISHIKEYAISMVAVILK